MYLIQLLLPLYDNDGRRFDRAMHAQVADVLTEKFGGLTAYSRAPAQGLWEDPQGQAVRDELIVYEVMAADLDRPWWARYRQALEERFRQQALVIRAQIITML